MDENSKIIQTFISQQTINFDDRSKTIIFLGYLKHDINTQAIVILRKSEFPAMTNSDNQMEKLLQGTNYFHNDIYKKFTLQFGSSSYNEIDCELIYPADKTHIDKYSRTQYRIINETQLSYTQCTQPFIEKQIKSNRLQWIYNILDKKAESEEILYEELGEQGFTLIRDYSFKPNSKVNNLHMIALSQNRKLNSLRDLTANHLELLQQIYTKGAKIISDKFDIPINQLKVFIHYLPSFYHFHVHFKHIEIPGDNYRDHLVLNVIQNIQLSNDYYQKVELLYLISDKLFETIFKN